MNTALSPARWLEIHSAGATKKRRPALCANSLHRMDFAPVSAPGAGDISTSPQRNFDTKFGGAA